VGPCESPVAEKLSSLQPPLPFAAALGLKNVPCRVSTRLRRCRLETWRSASCGMQGMQDGSLGSHGTAAPQQRQMPPTGKWCFLEPGSAVYAQNRDLAARSTDAQAIRPLPIRALQCGAQRLQLSPEARAQLEGSNLVGEVGWHGMAWGGVRWGRVGWVGVGWDGVGWGVV
jgi:hypothetical protein